MQINSYDTSILLTDEYFYNFLENSFKEIIYKIDNKYILVENLKEGRSKFETVINTLNGNIAEFIVFQELKKYIGEDRIISYNDVRNDNFKYPDAFDYIIISEGQNKIAIIDDLKKICINDTDPYSYPNYIKRISKYINVNNIKTIEIKSSKITEEQNHLIEEINSRPYISYAINKNEITKNSNKDYKILTLNEIKQTHIHIPMNEALQRLFPLQSDKIHNIDINVIQKTLYLLNSTSKGFLKDFHFNVFYNKKFNNLPINDNFNFQDILPYINKKFYFNNSFTTKQKIVSNSTHIGTLSNSVKAMYLINQTKNCNIPIEHINDYSKNKKIIIKGNKKNISFEHFFDNYFYASNGYQQYFAIFDNLNLKNINATIISLNNSKIISIKNITLFKNSEIDYSLFLSKTNSELEINPFLAATRIKIKK